MHPAPRAMNRTGFPGNRNRLSTIRHQLASTLVGQTVDLLADAKTIAHGVVTGVLNNSGVEKLIVGGMEYNLNQVLTVTPPALN